MALSDWLTICFSILGILAGAGISWMFFRTQMLTDFSSLREKLVELNVPRDVNAVVSPQIQAIHADVKDMQTKLNLMEQLNNTKEIASIRSTIEKIDSNLNSAIKDILSDVKAQQFQLAESIQKEFRTQSDTATNVVKEAFSSQLSNFIKDSGDKERLLKSLVESFMDGMRVMGEYQRKNIEKETSKSISDIEQKISNSIEEVLEEVVQLKNQIIAIPSSSNISKDNQA